MFTYFTYFAYYFFDIYCSGLLENGTFEMLMFYFYVSCYDKKLSLLKVLLLIAKEFPNEFFDLLFGETSTLS